MDRKIIIVTGASRGIGLAISKQLVDEGYYVIGTYTQDYSSEYLNRIKFQGFELMKLDVTDDVACANLIKNTIDKHGKISGLVNNAGISRDGLMLTMSSEMFKTVLDVNLVGAFNMIRPLAKHMLKNREGSIVNVASVIGLIGNIGQSNYAASKAGLIGYSKSLAKEFAPRNVRVNCVAPGYIKTDMTDILDEKTKSNILNIIAMNEFGTPQDVANAVSFLLGENSKYITGQTLNVCGGLVM